MLAWGQVSRGVGGGARGLIRGVGPPPVVG